jgi:hypothetical protein
VARGLFGAGFHALPPLTVVLQKDFAQPHGPQGFGVRFPQAAGFGGDDLGAAAADIDDQDALGRLRPVALDAEVNQARLFAAGDAAFWLPLSRMALVATARTPTTSSLR